MLVSEKLLRQSKVVFRRVKNVWRKKLGKCAIGIEVTPIPFRPAFSFSPILMQHH